MMRTFVFTLCFLMVSTVTAAKKLEISFWHSLGFHAKKVIEEMTDEYNRGRGDIQVNSIYQGSFDELQVKMLTVAVTRQLPDLAQVQLEFMESFIHNELIEPIEDEIPESVKGDVLPALWEMVTRRGRTYGIPFCISTDVFFYNENMFLKSGLDPDTPPATWDDMIRMGKILTRDNDSDGEPDSYGVMFWIYGLYGLAPVLHANGGELFSPDKSRVILTSPEMVKTIAMIQELVFKYRIMPRKWSEWESGQAFLTGKLAMGWFTSSAITYGEDNFPWRLRITALPLINGVRVPTIGGSALVNFAKGRAKRRAVNDFMCWLINKENTIQLHKKIGFVPVRKTALNSIELKAFLRENPNYAAPVEAVAYARPLPDHPDFYKINKELGEMLQRIILDAADPVDELARTEKKINQMLQ
jgi:sn-glycerol 3-phosphate transport system substrate-binding protein